LLNLYTLHGDKPAISIPYPPDLKLACFIDPYRFLKPERFHDNLKNMYKTIIFLISIIIMTESCQHTSVPKDSRYLSMVGDISYDPKLDDPNFTLCDEKNTKQYHNLNEEMQYEGEKYALDNIFATRYKQTGGATDSGMIRIRFMVNCKGQTGRFRMISSGYDYKEKQFNQAITDQLMTITKSLTGWKILSDKRGPKDYYQYLIFKIRDGQIKEILP